MNKTELVEKVREESLVPKVTVKTVVDTLFDVIKEELENGNKVKVTGFGVFESKKVKERKGRNPQTGEELVIPEHYKVTFKPSKVLKEEVNE